jgi:hypothetical protein
VYDTHDWLFVVYFLEERICNPCKVNGMCKEGHTCEKVGEIPDNYVAAHPKFQNSQSDLGICCNFFSPSFFKRKSKNFCLLELHCCCRMIMPKNLLLEQSKLFEKKK